LGLVLTAIAHILIVGIGEEVGWRGFALPRLQSKHTALKSTLILAPLWGFWHLPTFLFVNDLLTGFGLAIFFSVLSIPIAIIYTWLYNSTGGSLFIVSLWSTSTTLAIGSSAAKDIIPIIISTLLIIVAMLITNLTNTENLSRQAKVTLDH
jgi:membrane protease YdiL (CAAX protease family)